MIAPYTTVMKRLAAQTYFSSIVMSALAEELSDDAIEEVKEAMEGMLAPELKEEVTAQLEVRQVFHISKVGTVAGAYVVDGKVSRTNKARIIRDGIVIHTGQIDALKRFKDDVKEVSTNFECGISLVNYSDIREGDTIETFQEIEVKAKL